MDPIERALFGRSLRGAVENQTPGALDAELVALGWHDALDSDERAAISILFELQGASSTTSSALDHVLLRTVAPSLGTGVGIVLPALGEWRPPGRIEGATLVVRGLGTAALREHERVVVVAQAGEHEVAVVVPTADLGLREVEGLDPRLGLTEVSGEVTGVAGPAESNRASWPAAVAIGHLAVAHELVGASRRMLELGCEHALERTQFGQPIAGFQAVSHRLADTLVAIETAEAVLTAAWDDGSPQTAAMAKALAGRAGRTAARHAQQVLAGLGFTTEHPLHRFVRRTLVLDELLGPARRLTAELGTDLVRSRRPPAILAL
jgi:hypothetical protein